MLREINKLRSQSGSLMVEALAMLGLISMVTPVIYKKAAERTNEMQDINAASQIRTVVNGIDAYLKDNYNTIVSGGTVTSNSAADAYKEVNYSNFDFADNSTDTKTSDPINIEHFRDYLPLGFQNQGKIFRDLQVVIKETKDPNGTRKALTTVLIAHPNDGGQGFSKIRTSRIASMIGTNGGYVSGDKATGVQGVWEIPTNELPNEIQNNIKDGTIVATSIEAVADGTGGGKKVLYRVEVPGLPELNQMETALDMGQNAIERLQDLIAAGDSINIKGANDSETTLDVTGDGVFSSTLKAAEENFIAENTYTQIKPKLYVGTDTTDTTAKFMVDGNNGSMQALGGSFVAKINSGNPYIQLGSDSEPIFNANKNKISFMNQNVTIDPSGNTYMAGSADIGGNATIAGNTEISGTLSAIQTGSDGNSSYAFTADSNESSFYDDTLHVLNNRRVEIGRADNPADLRVYGTTTIDNLTVEDNFQAGRIGSSDNFGLSVAKDTGNTTVRANFSVLDSAGNDVLTVNKASDGKTFIKELSVGDANADKNHLGLYANINRVEMRYADGSDVNIGPASNPNATNLKATKGATYLGSGLRTSDTSQELIISDNDINAQAHFRVKGTDGNNILSVSPSSTSSGYYMDAQGNTYNSSVHIRKGAIELMRNQGTGTSSDSERFGYIKADRFVSNVQDANADGTGNQYQFEVNPAYTSMMNDIKLASRGGARLSDILPDFINKGIYVLDNTYAGNVNWESSNVSANGTLSGLSDCDGCNNASPWLGFIPTPHCPPNYAAVATITPIRFNMAQAGMAIGTNDTTSGGNQAISIAQSTNPAGLNLKIKKSGDSAENVYYPFVAISDNTGEGSNSYSFEGGSYITPKYWADIYNMPYNFQINTWLNTTIKKYYTGGKFQGWHGIMGFIYPAQQFANYTGGSYANDDIIWNLFPVYGQELSAIATIYCYFDRKRFNNKYVDPYLPHEANVGSIRYQNDGKSSTLQLNDPTLDYNTVW